MSRYSTSGIRKSMAVSNIARKTRTGYQATRDSVSNSRSKSRSKVLVVKNKSVEHSLDAQPIESGHNSVKGAEQTSVEDVEQESKE